MGIKLFLFPLPRTLFLKTLTQLRSNLSILADSTNVNHSNAPSQNLFLHFVTTRFNMSSAAAAKMQKCKPSLGRLQTLDNVEEVVSMLHRFGCNDDQIAYMIRTQPSLGRIQTLDNVEEVVYMIRTQPSILVVSVERVLEPKLQLLKDYGMGGHNLSKFEIWLPRILTAKLEILRSNLELLKTVFPTQDLLIRAVNKNYRGFGRGLKSLKTSIAFWEDFGFRGTKLTEFLLVNPRVLICTSLSPGHLDLIRRIDIPKENSKYKHIVSRVALSRIEVLEARVHSLQRFGLSPEQVIRAESSVLSMSEENIKKKMDFMINHMELSVEFVAKHPRLLSTSLDQVMRPRFLVLQKIMAMNGAVKFNLTRLFTILRMTEAKFVDQIIQQHPECATLLTVYKNAIVNVSKEVCDHEI